MQTTFKRRHQLGISELEAGEIVQQLDNPESFREV
jgi:hypothetical protein